MGYLDFVVLSLHFGSLWYGRLNTTHWGLLCPKIVPKKEGLQPIELFFLLCKLACRNFAYLFEYCHIK